MTCNSMWPKSQLGGFRTRLNHVGQLWRTIALVALLTASVATGAAEASRADSKALVDDVCELAANDDAVKARLRCARLHVMRDPGRPEQGHFELAVVIRKSANPKPGASPVLFLHGGPGGEMTRWMGGSGRDVSPGHDLVTFDMRGGGRSQPRVCDGVFSQLSRSFLRADGAELRAQLNEQCLQAWRSAGFAAQHFGTAMNVADAEHLRLALGVEQWLIYSVSYGTVVASHYLATHPDRIQAAVLDSLYPADDMITPLSDMQERLVDQLAEECQADRACRERWPTFNRVQLQRVLQAWDANPLVFEHQGESVHLNAMMLRRFLFAVASFESGARSIPFLLNAAERRDIELLRGLVSQIQQNSAEPINYAAMLATDCRDRARHHDVDRRDDPAQVLVGLDAAICRTWSPTVEPPRWPESIQNPTLVLSGGYDNFQPDAKWIQARMGASTRWIHVPAASHGVRDKGMCVRDLIGAFLDEPSAALQTACLESMPAPAFLLHASANKGLTRLAVPLANGALPTNPLMLALAAAVASMLLVVGIGIHTWRQQQQTRRKVDYRVWLGAAANVLPVAAIAALFATMTPEKMAALAYGLPEHWDFIQWLVPLPALVALLNTLMRPKAKALWFLGLAGLTVTTALLVDGWFL